MKKYPAGALVRISDICRHPKTGTPGLLPINRSTWWRWVKNGTVPAGMSLAGTSTKVWPIEVILNLAIPEPAAGTQAVERQQSNARENLPLTLLKSDRVTAKNGGTA